MNKEKYRAMIAEDFDEELNAMNVCTLLLNRLTWDQQWRVLNYLLVRLLGRSWTLSRPKSTLTDEQREYRRQQLEAARKNRWPKRKKRRRQNDRMSDSGGR